jgi:glycosyltransferase involved in cell wall biosynthesis
MIIVNARFLTQKVTGVQRFSIEISKILKKKYGTKIQFVSSPGIIHKELAKRLDAKVIGINKSHIWEQVDLFIYLIRMGSPLLLSFGFTGPLFYKNQIISIHDVAFKLYRNTFSFSFGLVYNYIVPRVAKKCRHIFTVSHSAKAELKQEFSICDSKISVIYNGISSIFKKTEIPKLKKPDKKYILTVSSHHPRKNYDRLIQAFQNLNDDSVDLYIIGNFSKHFTIKNNYSQIKNVKFLTDVDDRNLLYYYNNAELFIFPSLYEGFGIPAIEAMSQQIVCVLSDIPIFREIGDESVVYINPLSTKSITRGIKLGLRVNREKINYPKLDLFDWEKSGEKVISILKNYI